MRILAQLPSALTAPTGAANNGYAHLGWQVPAFNTALWLGRRHRLCLVIPVLNEGQRIHRLLNRMADLALAEQIDLLIVDGGSSDGSLALATLQQHGVRGLLQKTGPGRLSAQLRCAYAFALEQGYQGIITLDGNNKDDPAAVPSFIAALHRGVDFVQASRFITDGVAEHTPWLRTLAIRTIHAPLLRLASGFAWTDTTQGFRGYSRNLLLDPRIAPFRDVFDSYELLAYLSYRAPRLGWACREVPTTRRYPAGPVPTKIHGWRSHLQLLWILLRACSGSYNPPTPPRRDL